MQSCGVSIILFIISDKTGFNRRGWSTTSCRQRMRERGAPGSEPISVTNATETNTPMMQRHEHDPSSVSPTSSLASATVMINVPKEAKQHDHEASLNLLFAPCINAILSVCSCFHASSQRTVQILSGHGRHPRLGVFAPNRDIPWCHYKSDAVKAGG